MYLYICSHCGEWLHSFGYAELFAEMSKGIYKQPCPKCNAVMTQFDHDAKVMLTVSAQKTFVEHLQDRLNL